MWYLTECVSDNGGSDFSKRNLTRILEIFAENRNYTVWGCKQT